MVLQIVDTLINILMWLVGVAGLVVGVIFLTLFLRYKHTFIIRKITSGGKEVVLRDRAYIVNDKSKISKIKLFKIKKEAPIPPSSAIDIDKKGRYFIEAFLDENGLFTYIETRHKEILSERIPIDTEDREFYAQEILDAKKYETTDWKQFIVPIAALTVIAVIIIMGMIQWESISQPILSMADKQLDFQKENKQIVGMLQEIIQKKQIIGDDDNKIKDIPN